jgi:hypothetical protein
MRVDTKNLTIAEIKARKSEIIADKKSLMITAEPIAYNGESRTKSLTVTKQAADSDNPNELEVIFIGNTFKFVDSHLDMLLPGCADKTIKERGSRIPHLRDHNHSITGKVGKTLDVYTDMISVSEFGIESEVKTTEAIFMKSLVKKSLDSKTFDLYNEGEIDQHSIGMQYMRIELAANDPDYKEEFEVWEKYYSEVINKEVVDKRGYFWVVPEIKLFEISAVLFGSNELTPTVSTGKSIQAPTSVTLEDGSQAPTAVTPDEVKRRRNQILNT